MAAAEQPSQVFPPWLSLTTFRTVDPNGAPTTEASVVYLPLTYFGPSIPLGSNGLWVFGGSTSPPPSTSTPSPSSAVTSTTTFPTQRPSVSQISSQSFTPTPTVPASSSTFINPSSSITPSPTTTLIPFPNPSSSLSSTLSSTSQSTGLPSTSSVTNPTTSPSAGSPAGAASSSGHNLSARAIIAIIIVSVFVFVLLVFLCFLLTRRRKRRRSRAMQSTGSWGAFEVVDAEEGAAGDRDRTRPGSGERENDPLVSPVEPEMGETAPPYAAPPRLVTVPQASAAEGEEHGPPSAGTSRNSAAPVGIALAEEADSKSVQSSTLSALLRGDQQRTGPSASDTSLFYRPVYDSDTAPVVPSDSPSLPTFALSPAPRNMAARREALGNPTSAPLEPPPALTPNRLSSGEPATNLNSSVSSGRSTMPSIAYPDSPVSDIDETAALMTARRVRVDTNQSSNDSAARSIGASLARLGRLSWFNRSPSVVPSDGSLGSRPRSFGGITSAEMGMPDQHGVRPPNASQRNSLAVFQSHRSDVSGSSGQSVYYDAPSRPQSPQHQAPEPLTDDIMSQDIVDVLDIPIPPSAATSISSSGPRPEYLSFPPGLSLPWSGSRGRYGDNSSSSSFALLQQGGQDEHLDDAPPRIGERWERLRGGLTGGGSDGSLGRSSARQGYTIHERHSTISERVSLHSMRSHFGGTPHSAGSRANSRRSQPSSGSSLSYSNSITSDGRRRPRPNDVAGLNRVSMHAVGRRGGTESPAVSTSDVQPATVEGAPSLSGLTTVSDPSTGAIMHFPSQTWQSHQGEATWPEDAWTEFPGGSARWWGPPSTMQVYRSQTGDDGRL